MVYKFFDKRTNRYGVNNDENSILAEELHKPIIKNFKRRKVYSNSKDHIWGVDLADMSIINKFIKGIKYLLCVIDSFSTYSWVIPFKNKKGDHIAKGFKNKLDNSNRKSNKMWENFIIINLKIF